MDERVKGEYRQIYSELLSIILVFTAVSLLVKFFLFDAAVSECVTEFVILVFSPVYLAVRQFMCGIGPEDAVPAKRQKIRFFCALGGAGLGYLAASGAQGGLTDGGVWGNFLIFIAFFTLVYYVSGKLGKHFSEKKAKQYED